MTQKSNPSEKNTKLKRHDFNSFTRTILLYSVLILTSFTYTSTVFKRKEFGEAQINEVLFYLFNGLSTGNSSELIDMLLDNAIVFFVMLFLLLLPVVDFYRNRIKIDFNLSIFGRNQTLSFNPSNISWKFKFIYAGIACSMSVWFLLTSFQVPQYLNSLRETSSIYEDNYVDPRHVELEFPTNPNNLIMIYLESMENTLASISSGGQMEKSRIPELEDIALASNSVSFSNTQSGLGGAQPVLGTTWTAASLVSHQLGVPITSNVSNSKDNEYGDLNKFFPGAYGMGEVLRDAGYNQSFLMGSDSKFGGRDKLLKQHGSYKIVDHSYAQENNFIPEDYSVWWGYEDRLLFDFARSEITRLSDQDKPFNFQMLTADTHFPDGLLDDACATPYSRQYDNVYSCSSNWTGEFIRWIEEQPFAQDTTIVVVGDHLGMQQSYYDEIISDKNYTRTTYNVILNPATKYELTNSRQFAAFDMYPTTLSALGIKIPGERLGLGTNLFAQSHETLLEKYGTLSNLNKELAKRNQFYDRLIVTGIK